MLTLAQIILLFFGAFLIGTGFLMLIRPKTVRAILKKAGSTNFINYAEITIRMIPAAALIFYSEYSKFPDSFKVLGWFMIGTSLILYIVPRKTHHNYSLKCAEILKPIYFQLLSPFSMSFGILLIYAII
ncbi:MAG: hypothetical protein R2797_09965 [Gelidibacter sp.]